MSNKYLNGFLAGSLVGVVAAIMFTPKSTGKLRNRVMDSGKDLTDAVARFVPGLKSNS